MKTAFSFLIMILATTSSFAQTKKIAHRSHSGSSRTFTTNGESNFGLSPEMKRHSDSLRTERLRKDSINKARITGSLKKATSKKKNAASKNR